MRAGWPEYSANPGSCSTCANLLCRLAGGNPLLDVLEESGEVVAHSEQHALRTGNRPPRPRMAEDVGGVAVVVRDDLLERRNPVADRGTARAVDAFSRIDRPPTAGATIQLTIDKHLQHIVERELRAGIRAYDADAGAVVMLDPRNGEVLALASEPTFNPNAFATATPSERRNRAVQDVYRAGVDVQGRDRGGRDRGRRRGTRRGVRRQRGLHPGRPRPDSGLPQESPAHLHGRDRQVEQRRRDPGRTASRTRASQPLRGPFRFRTHPVTGPSVGEPRPRLERGYAQRSRHRLHLDGIPGGGHAVADGDGNRRGRQRRRAPAASRDPRRLPATEGA